jgi:ABC-type molybdate transport system substrate-binding protein
VQYGIAVVTASPNRSAAQAYVTKLLGRAAQAKLVRAGFLPRVKR